MQSSSRSLPFRMPPHRALLAALCVLVLMGFQCPGGGPQFAMVGVCQRDITPVSPDLVDEYEAFAKEHSGSGEFVFGDSVTLADCFLVPQMYNAHRFNVVVDDFPTLNSIVDACNKLPAFAAAIPEAQADAS